MGKAFFLDRDGVLIHDRNYLSDPAGVELCPHVAAALNLIRSHGFRIFAVSNQSGIARGYFTWEELKRVEQRIDELLALEGARIDQWYYCPHHIKGTVAPYAAACKCRKPEPGLLLAAAADHEIDLSQSFMIGDKLSDLKAGKAAGCGKNGFIRTPKEDADLTGFPDAIVGTDLLSVVGSMLECASERF